MIRLYEYTEIDENGTQISYFARRTKCNFKENARRKRNAKKRLENERYNYIIQVVKRLKLPIDNPAIIIGALIEAKNVITENNTIKINEYIEKYSLFVQKTEQINVEDIGKYEISSVTAEVEGA